jgi:hypothetical protein
LLTACVEPGIQLFGTASQRAGYPAAGVVGLQRERAPVAALEQLGQRVLQ